MTDKEDEITLDFSKITSFFKRKPGKGKPTHNPPKISAKPAEAKKGVRQSISDEELISKSEPNEATQEHSKETPDHHATLSAAKPKDKPSDEEEVSLDFSKLTSLFRPKPGSKPGHATSPGKSDESKDGGEVSLDFGRVKTFFAGINPAWLMLLLVLVPLVLGVYIRLQPMDLHATDAWAQSTVYNYYQNSIMAQINQQYPNLPDTKKNELLQTQFDTLLKTQKDQLEPQIADLSQRFKLEFRDAKGNNYMPDIDTYYWIRFIENVDKNGNPGDEIRDGQPFDNHYQAPEGRPVSKEEYFHIYLGYYFYKTLGIFDQAITPMVAFSYLPVFLSAICIILIFFITKRIAGNTGGFFAALILAVVPYFVTKTGFGYADTDIEVVFFPLLITFLFMEAYESHKLLKTLILGTLAGFCAGVFSFTWGGWWYIFDFLMGATGFYLIYFIAINWKKLSTKETRRELFDLATPVFVFFVASLVFVSLFGSFDIFTRFYTGPFGFTTLKSVATDTIWPNVYTTVAEQNEVPLENLISDIGGNFLFVLSVIGIFLTLLKKDKKGRMDLKYALLLAIWFLSTLYASTKGMRFILLIVPAFSVAFGVFVGLTVKHVSEYMEKELSIKKALGIVILAVIFALFLLPSLNNANQIAKSEMPDVSGAWVRTLTEIKTNSTPDAIVNSWWDFGHWFKYWADRPVTFDGTSQQTPRAHWIGKALLTSDEDEAVAILRMLDCGGDYPSLDLLAKYGDTLSTVELLKKAIMLDKSGSKALLIQSGVSEADAESISTVIHCEPPEDYFITSEDMVSKSGVWAHFGSWDFTRADMMLRVKSKDAIEGKKILSERYNLSQQQVDKYYYEIQTQDANNWIAGWPSYASAPSGCSESSDLVICANGLIFNLSTETAYAETATAGRMYIGTFSFMDQNGNFKIVTSDQNLLVGNDGKPLGAALYKADGAYQNILMSTDLVGSMFTRLFYFQGAGLKHFTHFYTDRDVRGTWIYTWKLDWEGK